VIVPVAEQHVKYLPECLRSLKTQSVQTHQVIVANDTGKPLRLNDGIKIVNTRGHEGAAVARNLAIERAVTPFVFFLDADDLAVGVAIETLLRAYASDGYNANYLYGDSFHDDDYYPAYQYDRQFLLRSNIHTVTALIPTESLKAIGGFDEKVPGWEDWELYIRLGVNGYCGERVPVPLIRYRVNTGINRNAHFQKWETIFADVRKVYGDYLDGRLEPMGCCGSNAKAKQAAQNFVNGLPPDTVRGDEVVCEYLGENRGAIPFRMTDGTVYRGANNPRDRFTRVKVKHVNELLDRGRWRQVPNSVLRARRPEPDPQPQVLPTPEPVQPIEVKTCVNCGHPRIFDSPQGCQALVNGKPCGCREYQEEEIKVKPPKDRRVKAK
jgi:hypothetical protein